MQRIAVASVTAACLLVASARVACADDGATDMKKMVQAEVEAAMKKKQEADAKDQVFRGRWNNGPYWQTADKEFSLRISARIHLDSVFTEADDGIEGPAPGIGDDFDDATYFRRLRLGISGDLGKHVDYKFDVDFADPSDPGLRDGYITIKNLKDCWGCWWPSIRVGQQYEPIGLETNTSDNNTSFIERAAMVNLHPERSIGISFFDSFWKDRATAALGVFSTDADDDENGFALWDESEADGGWAVTARGTVIPWAKDTCHFLHLGASVSYRQPNQVQYRARPGLGRGPRVVDTGVISDVDGVFLWNAEIGLEWHAFHASAEYTSVTLQDSPTVGDPTFTAYYLGVGYFLTGEARGYDWKKGWWGGTKPCCNFLSNNCCCWGALEVAARYDFIDLNDGTLSGGEMSTIAVGVNWYLNAYARLMFNYVIANVQDRVGPGGVVISDADVNSFLMRWDVHF
jgi:phosphate-selective porin OprO and OprP